MLKDFIGYTCIFSFLRKKNYNSKWLISVRKSSLNDEIHSNYMTGNDYSFTGNERKMFPFCINLPKDLIIVYAKVQLNILSGFGVINFETLFRLIAQCGMAHCHSKYPNTCKRVLRFIFRKILKKVNQGIFNPCGAYDF